MYFFLFSSSVFPLGCFVLKGLDNLRFCAMKGRYSFTAAVLKSAGRVGHLKNIDRIWNRPTQLTFRCFVFTRWFLYSLSKLNR